MPPCSWFDFDHFLKRSIQLYHNATPTAVLMWRTSNSFCEDNWGGPRKELMSSYRCQNDSVVAQHDAYAGCMRMYGFSMAQCTKMLLGREAVMLQREQSVRLLQREFPEVGLVDAFTLTEGSCNTADRGDAVHRVKLLNHINLAFLRDLRRRIDLRDA